MVNALFSSRQPDGTKQFKLEGGGKPLLICTQENVRGETKALQEWSHDFGKCISLEMHGLN